MFKCKICGKKYTELAALYNHIENKHKDMIPKDMSVQQYYYYMKTGKMNGNCVMCKNPTGWNHNTGKYNRFCGNPKCKDEYVKIMKSRMVAKYGKTHLLNDPNKQREMLANRSISGVYKWSDGKHETTYTGSYELDFLKTLDNFFDWDPEDISMPSPHTYTYKYEGEDKFYIPDVFIHSLDLEIEIKDGGDNPNNHHKIQDVDKEKERLKDEVLCSQKAFHYVKITNKNYENLFRFLKEIKQQFEKHSDETKIPRIFKIEDIKGTSVKPIKESIEVIDEAYMRNKKDLYVNFELFDSGKSNICLVTGLSGSGKSTLSKELCKKYNATCIEMDVFEHPDMKIGPNSRKNIYDKYFNNNPILKTNLINNNLNNDELALEMSNALVYAIKYCNEHPDEKFIIEGLQIFSDINPDFVKGLPIVFVNTSMINSMLRKVKRDKYRYKVSDLFEWYIADEKKFNGFKQEIIDEGFHQKANDLIVKFDKFTNVKYRERDYFFSLRYDLAKNNPKEMQKLLTSMIKAARFEDDIHYIEKMTKKADEYYYHQIKIKKHPEFEDPYKEFYKWINDGGMKKEIKERRKDFKLQESNEIIEEKFEPDKFLVWFDKPLKKMIGGKIKLYHGSLINMKEKQIDPISFNVGATKFSDPRWSTYFWDNKEDAINWASVWAVSEYHKYCLMMGHNGKNIIGIPEGLNEKEFAKDLVEKMKNFKFYVYECEVDMKDLEIGSCPSIREYTVSKPTPIVKKYEYEMNNELLRRFYKFVSMEEIHELKKNRQTIKNLKLHRGMILNNILDNSRDSYRGIIRTDFKNGNIKFGDDLSGYKDSINYHIKNNSYGLHESYIINTMKESSISIPQMNYYLQNEYEEEMKNYLNTYKKYYNLMLKEQPAAVKHINEDIRQCLIVIDGLASKGVENNLVQFAKDDLGEIVKASKKGKPVKVVESMVSDITSIDDKLNDISLISVCGNDVSISNEKVVDCKIVYDMTNSKNSIFAITDTNSKLIIENLYVIQRDKVGTHCSITPLYSEQEGENILEFQIILNKSVDIQSLNNKLNDGVNIANLHKFNDDEFKFIKESCLKLFGQSPEMVLEGFSKKLNKEEAAEKVANTYKKYQKRYPDAKLDILEFTKGPKEYFVEIYSKKAKKHLFKKSFSIEEYPDIDKLIYKKIK